MELSEIPETCTATTTELDFSVKASGEQTSGSVSVVDGRSVHSWGYSEGTASSDAHAISNMVICDETNTAPIKNTGKVNAGCVKIEGSQLGQDQILTVGSVTVFVSGWGSKDGEPNEYTSVSFVVCGTDTVSGTDPGGTDPGGTDPGGTDPGGSTGGEEPVN